MTKNNNSENFFYISSRYQKLYFTKKTAEKFFLQLIADSTTNYYDKQKFFKFFEASLRNIILKINQQGHEKINSHTLETLIQYEKNSLLSKNFDSLPDSIRRDNKISLSLLVDSYFSNIKPQLFNTLNTFLAYNDEQTSKKTETIFESLNNISEQYSNEQSLQIKKDITDKLQFIHDDIKNKKSVLPEKSIQYILDLQNDPTYIFLNENDKDRLFLSKLTLLIENPEYFNFSNKYNALFKNFSSTEITTTLSDEHKKHLLTLLSSNFNSNDSSAFFYRFIRDIFNTLNQDSQIYLLEQVIDNFEYISKNIQPSKLIITDENKKTIVSLRKDYLDILQQQFLFFSEFILLNNDFKSIIDNYNSLDLNSQKKYLIKNFIKYTTPSVANKIIEIFSLQNLDFDDIYDHSIVQNHNMLSWVLHNIKYSNSLTLICKFIKNQASEENLELLVNKPLDNITISSTTRDYIAYIFEHLKDAKYSKSLKNKILEQILNNLKNNSAYNDFLTLAFDMRLVTNEYLLNNIDDIDSYLLNFAKEDFKNFIKMIKILSCDDLNSFQNKFKSNILNIFNNHFSLKEINNEIVAKFISSFAVNLTFEEKEKIFLNPQIIGSAPNNRGAIQKLSTALNFSDNEQEKIFSKLNINGDFPEPFIFLIPNNTDTLNEYIKHISDLCIEKETPQYLIFDELNENIKTKISQNIIQEKGYSFYFKILCKLAAYSNFTSGYGLPYKSLLVKKGYYDLTKSNPLSDLVEQSFLDSKTDVTKLSYIISHINEVFFQNKLHHYEVNKKSPIDLLFEKSLSRSTNEDISKLFNNKDSLIFKTNGIFSFKTEKNPLQIIIGENFKIAYDSSEVESPQIENNKDFYKNINQNIESLKKIIFEAKEWNLDVKIQTDNLILKFQQLSKKIEPIIDILDINHLLFLENNFIKYLTDSLLSYNSAIKKHNALSSGAFSFFKNITAKSEIDDEIKKQLTLLDKQLSSIEANIFETINNNSLFDLKARTRFLDAKLADENPVNNEYQPPKRKM